MSTPMSHQQAQELIPWLVNGTLRDGERAALERHVHDCLPCRADLKQQRALAALVAEQREAHLSPDAGFDALMRRADARRSARFSQRLAIAASFAIALVVSTAVFVSLHNAPPDFGFVTLGDHGNTTTRLDIVFDSDVTEAEMRAIVRDIGGTIVAGPSDVGRYTVELVSADPIEADLESTLARLQRDRRVRFAGRSFIPPETR